MIPAAQDRSRWEFIAKKAVENYIEYLNEIPVYVTGLSNLMLSGAYNGLEMGIIEKIRQELPHIKIQFETEMKENELQVFLWFKHQNMEERYSCFLTILIMIGKGGYLSRSEARVRREKPILRMLCSSR